MKSYKIRASANGESCALRVSNQCDDDTVVYAHINTVYRGIGIKSPDLFGVYCCYPCHQLLDSSKVDYDDQLRAMIETQYKLMKKDLVILK